MARCRRRTSARTVGRGLLASSHAGTRLPIAVTSRRIRGRSAGPDTGRSPSVRSRLSRAACLFLRCTSLLQKSQKTADAPWVPAFKVQYELPPVALPTSGKGSKQCFLSAVRLPCFRPYYATAAKSCQEGLRRPPNRCKISGNVPEKSAGADLLPEEDVYETAIERPAALCR